MARTSRSRSSATRDATRGTALVTGAAKRLGAAIALALAEDGWDIAVHYGRSAKDADTVVAAVERTGRRAVALDADLADESATRALIDRTAAALAAPTCLVNCASLFDADTALDVDYGRLASHLTVNLAAPIVLAQAMHRRLTARGSKALPDGVVINVLDQKLFNPNPDFLSYTLSKAALQTATGLLARALAPRLRIVGVAPGITLPSADQTRAEFAKAHRATPLGRSSTPADIAQAICFLATSPAITGDVLIVDGGQHLVPTARDVMFVTRAQA